MVQVQKRKKDSPRSRLNRWKKSADFTGSFLDEIKRIDWTSKSDLKDYTKIVLLSVLFFGMLVYSIDLVIRKSLGLIEIVMGFFFG